MPTPRALEHQYAKTDVSGNGELGAVRECNVIYVHDFNVVIYIYDRFQPSAWPVTLSRLEEEVACASLSGGKG
jgi:hypothetical protein